ncbi:MAG: hypothetical protein KAJ14_02365 [Candidatus Omnitrophica bacterium]|nr:hypothetical protein [Candidatus Omnitrophota bacterium]
MDDGRKGEGKHKEKGKRLKEKGKKERKEDIEICFAKLVEIGCKRIKINN